MWKSTSELGCVDLFCEPPRHRTGAVTGTETQLRRQHRVDGVGRPNFDSTQARTSPTYSRKRPTTRNRRSAPPRSPTPRNINGSASRRRSRPRGRASRRTKKIKRRMKSSSSRPRSARTRVASSRRNYPRLGGMAMPERSRSTLAWSKLARRK